MSVRRDGSWVRKERIQKIWQMIEGTGEVKLTKFLALCEFKFGLTRPTVRQYLQILIDLERISISDANDTIVELAPNVG